MMMFKILLVVFFQMFMIVFFSWFIFNWLCLFYKM